jgi:hypothetical protein
MSPRPDKAHTVKPGAIMHTKCGFGNVASRLI